MNNKISQLNIFTDIQSFIAMYGELALLEAMQQYIDNQQVYIYKYKTHLSKIKINDIYYIQSKQHCITIHTLQNTFKKYGTLTEELTTLSPYGFVKCSQSCIVSLSKIKIIQNNDAVLIDDTKLHISRSCFPKIFAAFKGKS